MQDRPPPVFDLLILASCTVTGSLGRTGVPMIDPFAERERAPEGRVIILSLIS